MGAWYDMRFHERPNTVRVDCSECGRAMYFPPSKANNNKRCGGECTKAWRRREHQALVRPCARCNKDFRPRPIQIAAGGGRFCSQACNVAFREAGNTAEARAKARATRLAGEAEGRTRRPRGAEVHNWKGGIEAQRARQKTPDYRAADAARLRKYRAENPNKVREFASRRAGKKLGRLEYGSIPRIGKAQKWKCAICRVSVKNAYHVDHVQPLAKGGEHAARNIQLLCATCNVRKNARDPIDYMRSLGRLL